MSKPLVTPAFRAILPAASRRRLFLGAIGGLALAVAAGAPALAQNWPTKNVTIVVPYPPGSGPDALARVLGDRLSTATGKPFIVENKPGANAIIGSTYTARAPGDGHTLLLADRLTLAVNPVLYAKSQFNPKELTGVSEVARVNLLFVTRTDAPYKTWAEMTQFAREKKGELAVGTGGVGSVHSLSLELIKRSIGADILEVPYKGVALAANALLSKDVNGVITGPETVLGQIRAGKVRALAIGADTRSPLLPDTPTLKELGAPADLLLTTHFSLLAPAKTPAAVIEKINAATRAVVSDPGFVKTFQERGLVAGASTAKAVDDGIAQDTARFGKMLQELGIKLD